ncbi:hypothetical protein DPM19_07145 [Actinomadura craniellae]|uniref:Uncharacterized protein n=1 Tax=Actinomadura craniellae TaxID=2231787 RepID=A0A365H8V2_9ACTN|nr:hypothetical protein DPM19_07145 [Actinomadura craniellae]
MPDAVVEDAVEQRLKSRWPKVWQKAPDSPLGEAVTYRLERRVQLGIDEPEGAASRIERIQRRRRRG